MTQLDILTFEDQTDGVTIGTLPSPWLVNPGSAAITAAAAAAIHGTLGARIVASTTFSSIQYPQTAGTPTRVFAGYFIIRTMPTANAYICNLNNGASAIGTDWRVGTDGKVTARNNSVAIGTSTAALSVDTIYHFEWQVTSTTQELRIYQGESSTPLITVSGANTGGTYDRALIGLNNGNTGAAIDLDTLQVADDWLAPFAPGAVPAGWNEVRLFAPTS